MTEIINPIPARLKNAAQGGHVAGSEDIDAGGNKNQKQVNDDVNLGIQIINDKIGTMSGNKTINERLDDLEAMEEIVIDGGEAQIAQGSDFTNPDATKRAKIPTVGAIVDGLNDGIYDVSKRNPTGGPNSDGKFTLDYILNNANTLIPTGWRHGGMTISFVDSSDNKYVQFRYMSSSTAVATFTNVDNWRGVDVEPTAGSKNLVESGGVQNEINTITGTNGADVTTYKSYIRNCYLIPTTSAKFNYLKSLNPQTINLRYIGVRNPDLGTNSVFGLTLMFDGTNYATYYTTDVPNLLNGNIIELPLKGPKAGELSSGYRVFVEFNQNIDFSTASGLIASANVFLNVLNREQISFILPLIQIQENLSTEFLRDIASKTNGVYMKSGTEYSGNFTENTVLRTDGTTNSLTVPNMKISDLFKPTGERDISLVRLNKLFPTQNSDAKKPTSCNVCLYDENQNFVSWYILSSSCIVAVPKGYYLRTLHYSADGDFSDCIYTDIEIDAVENKFIELDEKFGEIQPFFDTYSTLTPLSINNGAYISSNGNIIEDPDFSYIIYDVTGLDKINLHIGKNAMWGAVIWTTYSGLNSGEIDGSLKIRNHVGEESEKNVPYDIEISLQSNENFIVIANLTENFNDYGYSVVAYSGLYDGKSAQELEENVDSLNLCADTAINNKNIVLLGDSITWQGGVDCTQTQGWSYWFKNRLKPKSIKSFAWSGATWSNDANTAVNDNPPLALDDDNTIWQQVRKLIAAYNNNTQVKPDVIIIAAGVNDVIAIGRGERTGCLDKTAAQAFANRTAYITSASVGTILTVADAIRYAFELLLQTFPDVQIILTTPLQASYSEVNQERWDKVTTIIKECAAFISANVIEQGRECGIYYTQEYLGHYNLSDGLHPNATGAKKIGNIIASRVRAMV